MENNGFKNVCVKNRTCYYFDELIKLEDFEIDNILIDKKSQETILINGITYTILIGSKTSVDGFIKIYHRNRYLTLFDSDIYDAIYDKIRYHISLKSAIRYIFSKNFAKIKVDSLPIEKALNLCNIMLLVKFSF